MPRMTRETAEGILTAHAEACAIAEARSLVAKHMEPNQ